MTGPAHTGKPAELRGTAVPETGYPSGERRAAWRAHHAVAWLGDAGAGLRNAGLAGGAAAPARRRSLPYAEPQFCLGDAGGEVFWREHVAMHHWLGSGSLSWGLSCWEEACERRVLGVMQRAVSQRRTAVAARCHAGSAAGQRFSDVYLRAVARFVRHGALLLGLTGYVASMGCWYLALHRMALSKAYALLSLSYIWCGVRQSCCPAGEHFSGMGYWASR